MSNCTTFEVQVLKIIHILCFFFWCVFLSIYVFPALALCSVLAGGSKPDSTFLCS